MSSANFIEATAAPTGSPLALIQRGTWERLVFAGIGFRFENAEMVRIGIPGR